VSDAIEPQVGAIDLKKPTSEFLRWILVVSVLVISEACALEGFLGNWTVPAIYISIWTVNGLAEAWIQFSSWKRRLMWTFAGLLTGLCLSPFDSDSGLAGFYVTFILFVPATLEYAAARAVRKRPWFWFIVTPACYGLWKVWADPGWEFAGESMRWLIALSGIAWPVSSRVPATASMLGILFLTRAGAGSYVASRKHVD
jgi:hypothetical protein